MEPTLRRVAGPDRLLKGLPHTGAEDFAFLSQRAPGLYFWLGVRSPAVAEKDAASIHSPLFRVDESALILGVRAMANLAVDFLTMQSAAGTQ
jgi:amidohydrolase